MMFQLVPLVNYSKKLCLKMNEVDNIEGAARVNNVSLLKLIEITTKKNKKTRP